MHAPSSSTPATPPQHVVDDVPPSLSWPAFGVCLAIVLAIFVGLNPLWQPLDMQRVDDNILWSYVPIPLLVLAALAYERKLRWSSWLLETTRLTLVKLGVTFVAMHVVWSLGGLPQSEVVQAAPMSAGAASDRFSLVQAPPATVLAPDATGALAGRVVDGAGQPVAGALVAVVGGLQRFEFAPPTDTVLLEHGVSGFQPDFAIVHTYQPLLLRATDDVLHTAHARGLDGQPLFNYPALPREGRTLMFRRPAGVVELSCKVHGDDRSPAYVAIVSNPFATRTDADGRFAWSGVPAGELQLEAWLPGHAPQQVEVTVTAGGEASVDFVLR